MRGESPGMLGAERQPLRAMAWEGDALTYVDQRYLPSDLVYARATDPRAVIDAISSSAVTGPRSIDAFCAFGVVFIRRASLPPISFDQALSQLRTAALSFGYGCHSMDRVVAAPSAAALSKATAILEEAENIDRAIAGHALAVIPARGAVVTLGSSGALATGGIGTAVGAIAAAHRAGRHVHAYVSETRPRLTGMRLAAYELQAAGVGCTVFPDGAAAALLQAASIAMVIVDAAAIAPNGDAIGETGTFGLALAAAHHRIPFYVTAPRALVVADQTAANNVPTQGIPPDFATSFTYTQRFDRTPGHLIAAIITEYGLVRPPYYESLPSLATRPRFELVGRGL